MNKANRIISIIEQIIVSRFPTKKKRVYFYNIWGKYNDSTRALYLEMSKRHPDFEYYYEVANDKVQVPTSVKAVRRNTAKSIFYKLTSRVVIDNDYGSFKWRGDEERARKIGWLMKQCIQKKTINFSVGHGTFIKTVGKDRKLDNYDEYISSTSYMCVSNRHWKETTERNTFGAISKFLLTGSPRNDCLFSGQDVVIEMKRKNDLVGKKIAIIAPTFRTQIVDGVVYHLGADDFIKNIKENAQNLTTCLQAKFGGEWILGIRMHPGINTSSFQRSKYIFSANEMDDISDYLMMSDLLITDYSSCAFDMAITYKPCFLLWEDEDYYRNEEQGLYFSREELPFPIADNMKDLIEKIKEFDCDDYKRKLDEYFKRYDMFTGDNSSQLVVDCIDQVLGYNNQDSIGKLLMR